MATFGSIHLPQCGNLHRKKRAASRRVVVLVGSAPPLFHFKTRAFGALASVLSMQCAVIRLQPGVSTLLVECENNRKSPVISAESILEMDYQPPWSNGLDTQIDQNEGRRASQTAMKPTNTGSRMIGAVPTLHPNHAGIPVETLTPRLSNFNLSSWLAQLCYRRMDWHSIHGMYSRHG